MRNRASLFGFSIIVVALLVILGGCSTDEGANAGPLPITNDSGTKLSGTGSGREWGYHGWVDVELTLADGWITEATVTGPDETPGVGAAAIQRAPAIIKQKNSVEIDVVASASITTEAIRKAGRQAIDEIKAGGAGG
ncbi:MAG: FMN-binding protein [Spirochaetaceae bacterium]|nr:FMN-binding protein [Spirochaetaceae bacterium]